MGTAWHIYASQSHVTTGGQSVCQSVSQPVCLGVKPCPELMTRYLFDNFCPALVVRPP